MYPPEGGETKGSDIERETELDTHELAQERGKLRVLLAS